MDMHERCMVLLLAHGLRLCRGGILRAIEDLGSLVRVAGNVDERLRAVAEADDNEFVGTGGVAHIVLHYAHAAVFNILCDAQNEVHICFADKLRDALADMIVVKRCKVECKSPQLDAIHHYQLA